MRVSDVLDIIDGGDSDIGDDADENDSDGDEDYQPRQDQSSDDSDSADDSNQSFVPVAVQYCRPPPDATSSQSTSTTSSASKPQSSTSRGKAKVPKPTYNWKKCPSQPPDCTFLGPSEDIDFQDVSPLELFSKFITDEMVAMVVEQTNLYSCQKSGKVINVNHKELKQTIGIYLLMGVIRLDSQRDYWAEETRIDQIASVMPRDRFESILSSIHFVNNMEKEKERTGKIWKISPWLDRLRTQCLSATPPTEYSSVDEMIIPFQGKFSKIKQYVKGKPHPWEFKIWARTDSSGVLQDFELYQGKVENTPSPASQPATATTSRTATPDPVPRPSPSPRSRPTSAASSRSATPDPVPRPSPGTVRKNRLPGCDLKSDKTLEAEGRGSFDSRVEVGRKIIAVRWMDTKCVTLLSSHTGVDPTENVNRWDKKTKTFKPVPRPQIVKLYNHYMGGVDCLDRMCAKSRFHIRSKRWYMHIFWFTIKIALANAWIIYRRKHLAMGDVKKDIMKLKKFQSYVAKCLIQADTSKKRGRPSLEEAAIAEAPAPPVQRKKPRVEPPSEVRYDGVDHRISFTDRGKCSLCKTGFCETQCHKCNVRLCVKKKKNCFDIYHYK
ncbi:hypothetical protein RRG08_017855 [Elysia crispata]|uniref:PiggyBac transposable element-derived protein domain-containing protein n=1 Tax=Elysia crispata TaxID=231223 RepID=A0AAE0XPM7_9GAST|nr:hypothetical protein RRG08_017855 [Elysia crispata]